MNERIIIERKAVSDALYELEHLIQEQIPPEDIRYPGAKRRAESLRKALGTATTFSPAVAEEPAGRPVALQVDDNVLLSLRKSGW